MELLEAIADDSPAPASGFVSGVVVAMAAALDEHGGAQVARRLAERTARSRKPSTSAGAAPLAQENADAFVEALPLLDAPAQGRDMDLGRRCRAPPKCRW